MSFGPDIKFIKNHVEEHLEKFTDEVRAASHEAAWRCLYAAVDPKITKDPTSKKIAEAFLKSSFEEAFDIKAFWLSSGHLFIFFQGPVRAVIRNYEIFLKSLNENEQCPEYHFFWEISRFWGYFDEVLSSTIKDKDTPAQEDREEEKEEGKEQEKTGFKEPLVFDCDQKRQRQIRYKPLLLIVEDDRVTRHMLQACMEKYCDIVVAWNAEQARKFYRRMMPNIAFLDIELPDGDGQELAELFCGHDAESFVVMVSAHDTKETRTRCAAAGTKGFVAKPATEAHLLKYVDQYNKSRQHKRIASK